MLYVYIYTNMYIFIQKCKYICDAMFTSLVSEPQIQLYMNALVCTLLLFLEFYIGLDTSFIIRITCTMQATRTKFLFLDQIKTSSFHK